MRQECGRAALVAVIVMLVVAACGEGDPVAEPTTTTYPVRPTVTTIPLTEQPIIVNGSLDLCEHFTLEEVAATTSLRVTRARPTGQFGRGCSWNVTTPITGSAIEKVHVVLNAERRAAIDFNAATATNEVIPGLGDRAVVLQPSEPALSPLYKFGIGVVRGPVVMAIECVRENQVTDDPAVKAVYERQILETCNRPMAELVLSKLSA